MAGVSLDAVMSDGNGGSGGGGGVRGGDGARVSGPGALRCRGYQGGWRSALSPGLAGLRAPGGVADADAGAGAAGDGNGKEGTEESCCGGGPLWSWPSGVCCGCTARGAGGGGGPCCCYAAGAGGGTHPDPHVAWTGA